MVVGIQGYRVLKVLDKVLGYRDAPYMKRGMCIWFLPTVVKDHHCLMGLWVIRVFDGQVLVLVMYMSMGKR